MFYWFPPSLSNRIGDFSKDSIHPSFTGCHSQSQAVTMSERGGFQVVSMSFFLVKEGSHFSELFQRCMCRQSVFILRLTTGTSSLGQCMGYQIYAYRLSYTHKVLENVRSHVCYSSGMSVCKRKSMPMAIWPWNLGHLSTDFDFYFDHWTWSWFRMNGRDK